MAAEAGRPTFKLEHALSAGGFRLIAGLDEAGRGALAGPVVAAAVIFPTDRPDLAETLRAVHDSKQLSASRRQHAFQLIQHEAISWSTGSASNTEVDQLGLLPATRLAMHRALAALEPQPEHLLLDYILLSEDERPQTSQAKADAKSLSVAAASIMAKVSRDQHMIECDDHYPEYGFCRHKGYGTSEHRQALQRLGPTPLHRQSYQPVARVSSHKKDK